MDFFNLKNGELYAEDVPLRHVAERYGTPCYVYSRATLERHWRAFDDAFGDHPHLVCYGVKANSSLAVLDVLARLGSGFDIVSVGELERVLAAGGRPDRVVFSGVGKRADEIRRALEVGIRCFNIESDAELETVNRVAGELGVVAPVSLRVNPDVDAKTHPYISTGLRDNKFGIAIERAAAVYARAAEMPHVDAVGVDCHIGSQLTDLDPFDDALERLITLVERLRADGIALRHIDLGGGLGIRYRDENPPPPAAQIERLLGPLRARCPELDVWIEPGRAIAGNAGVLLTRVELTKAGDDKHFAVVDAAMNDLLRPALYEAWHDIVPVLPRRADSHEVPVRDYDIVGPVCESADFLGKQRSLALREGDLLAVRSAGAYAFTMSSNYNTRPRAAEVMVDGEAAIEVRPRETIAALFADERRLP